MSGLIGTGVNGRLVMLATTTVDANRGVEYPNCIGSCVTSDTALTHWSERSPTNIRLYGELFLNMAESPRDEVFNHGHEIAVELLARLKISHKSWTSSSCIIIVQ